MEVRARVRTRARNVGSQDRSRARTFVYTLMPKASCKKIVLVRSYVIMWVFNQRFL